MKKIEVRGAQIEYNPLEKKMTVKISTDEKVLDLGAAIKGTQAANADAIASIKTMKPLEKLILPPDVTNMDSEVFDHADVSVVVWPTKCSYIPQRAFASSKIKEVQNIGHVVEIGGYAFWNCIQLKEFTVPDGVVIIRERCFKDSGLSKINNLNVLNVEEGAFQHCKLSEIQWPPFAAAIPKDCFANCVKLKKITGTESVSIIGKDAFTSSSIETIDLPMVVSIGDSAFCYAENLHSINLGPNTQSIGEQAFTHSGLKGDFRWPTNAREIKNNTFECCKDLTNISNIDGIMEIGVSAFHKSGLQSLDLSHGICHSICSYAFSGAPLKDFKAGYWLSSVDPTAFDNTPVGEEMTIS